MKRHRLCFLSPLFLLGLLGLTACQERAVPVPVPVYAPSSPVPAAPVVAETPSPYPAVPGQQDLVLSEPAKQALLRFARLTCNGQVAEAQQLELPAELAGLNAPLIAMAFEEDGRVRGKQRLDDPSLPLAGKVARVVPGLCTPDPRVFLHLQVLSYQVRMPNFGVKGLFDNKVYEPQVTGVVWEWQGKRAELSPVEALALNLGPQSSRIRLARDLGLEPRRAESSSELTVEFYRVLHFGEAPPDRSFASYHRGHVLLRPEEVTHELLEQRLRLIGDWYRHNVHDGEVTYEYSVYQAREQNEPRTMVRSTMATWILNRLAFYLKDDELKRLGEVTLGHYLEHYFQMTESLQAGKIKPADLTLPSGDRVPNRYTAGSFIASAILERDDRARWEREVGLLMDWAMTYARPDGTMRTQGAESQYFMPGQLLLAVSYAYDRSRDEKYRTFFDKVFTAYEKPLYGQMHLGNQRYIPYAPAWFTQPAAKMFLLTGEARYRELVYTINDRVALLYPHNAREQVYYDYDGALMPKTHGFANTSVTAAALESLVDAAIVAQKDGDARRLATYARAIRHTTAFLLRLQYVPANTYYLRNRERVFGGFKKDMLNTVLWMDNVWHLTSAFMKIQQNKLLEVGDAGPGAAEQGAPAGDAAAPSGGPAVVPPGAEPAPEAAPAQP